MKEAHEKFPEYLWKQNKGYPTRAHRDAVKKFGASLFHRKTFLRNILEEGKQEKLF
jgi:ribonuclease HII